MLIMLFAQLQIQYSYEMRSNNSFPTGGADDLGKQLRPRSGPTFCRAWSGSNLTLSDETP